MGNKKKTQDEFIKEVEQLGNGEYEVLGEYKNNKTPIKLKHNVCGFEWNPRPNYFISGNRCPKCAGKVRKDTEYFKQEIYRKVGNEYSVISEYKGTHRKVTFIHNKCGNVFDMDADNFLSQGQRCPKCQHRSYRKTTDEFKQEIYEAVGNEYELLSEYVNSKTKVEILHKNCNMTYFVTPSSFIQGDRCPHCYRNIPPTQDEFKQIVEDKLGEDYIVIGNYVNNITKIEMKHKTCGHTYFSRPSDIVYHRSGCPYCKKSKAEIDIENFCINNNIEYESQKKYQGLVGDTGMPLSYDFFIPKYNILIEANGQQHEKAVEYFGGEKHFQKQQRYDNLKRNYANQNGIKLLEIWYYDFDKINEILNKSLGINPSA